MDEHNTIFDPFCGWYKCRSCGVNETFIPPLCPVCGKPVENYQPRKTSQLREERTMQHGSISDSRKPV